jgi:hypothetical protein
VFGSTSDSTSDVIRLSLRVFQGCTLKSALCGRG